MDNQQEKIDLSYYAGLMDGEGCYTLGFCTKKNGTKQINPAINLTNTNEKILDFVIELYEKYGIKYHVQWHKPTVRCKPYATIGVHRRECMKRVLELAIPYLHGKQRQAELMLEFINSRLATFASAQRNAKAWRYTENELSLARQIQALNQKGSKKLLNDYTQEPALGHDIVYSGSESASPFENSMAA